MLDRETIPSYSLIVTAQDMAQEPEKHLSSTVQVKFVSYSDTSHGAECVFFFF